MGFKVTVNDTVEKVYPYRFQAIIYCFMKQCVYSGKGHCFLDPKVKIVESEEEMEHSIIYLTDTEKTIGNIKIKARVGLAKEGLWQSIVSDIFTFCMILFSFCINAYFIHSRLLSCLLLFMFLFMINKKQKAITKEEFLELVKNELESEE